MSYNGIALHNSFEKGRRSCTISTGPGHIAFSTGEEVIKFPLHQIDISSGGAGNRLIYFRHPHFPGWCFYSGDKALLKDPFLAREEEGKKVFSKMKTGNRIVISVLATIVLLVILSISLVFLFRKALVYEVAQTVPVEWEEAAGGAIFESVTSENPVIQDSILHLQMNRLGSLLTRNTEENPFQFRFYVTEDSSLNAFALPGGRVVVHSGLILQADNVEEVLGVLAHEIAHVTERHHARGLISRMGVTIVLSSFFAPDSELADLIINTGGTLQALKYDRELESEADEKGLEILEKAGVDPAGMITFFRKLESQSEGNYVPEFLSTHPATTERIEELKDKTAPSEKQYAPVDFDFEAFKERLKTHLNN